MEYLLVAFISFAAFFLKGVTGTGTTTVIVAFGVLFIDPKQIIVLASFINIFGGLSMVRVDPVPLPRKYWIPVSATMVAGSVMGAVALGIIPNQQFRLILGIAFLATALWFLFRNTQPRENRCIPSVASALDLGVGIIAGFCGGFIGINAPPLVLHFSRNLDKRRLRRFLVLIFIPGAMAQTATFTANGLFNQHILVLGVCMLPAMFLGIQLGNQTFHRISEAMFRRILGLLLVFVSIRLILKALAAF